METERFRAFGENDMSYQKKIVQSINKFYVECVEEFREAEQRIANDSKFRRLFQKKNYGANIELLRRCRNVSRSIRFPTGEIEAGDTASRDIILMCESCIRQFNKLCDSYIQLQLALKKKAEGGDMPYKEYIGIYHVTQEHHAKMNSQLHELDIMYADYTEDMEYGDLYFG